MVEIEKKKKINPLTKQPVGFSKEKGGYTNEGGSFYPTTNPDFVPPKPSPTTAIQTYGGGFIRQGKEGNIVTTKAEEKAIGGSGAQTANVQSIQQAIKDKVTADRALQALHDLNVGTQTVEEEAGKMETAPTAEQMQQAAQPTANLVNQGVTKAQTDEPTQERPLNMFEEAINAPTPLSVSELKREASNAGLSVVKFGAQIYDFVQSLANEGKSINQKEAERTFSGLQGDVAQDLTLISQGLDVDLDATRKKIAMMENANNRLIESVNGRGKFNLRYWLTDGIDVETFAISNVDTINGLKLRLAYAQQQALLKQQKAKI